MNRDYYQKIKSNMATELIKKRKSNLKKSFQNFTGVPNRMEQIRVLNDIVFINDSKAENINATYFALQTVQKPVIWIAGGDDAQTDYWELMALVRSKVEAIIMIGESNERLFMSFSPVMENIYEVKTMQEAVALSYRLSEPKTSVLLSPACKPDLRFADFEDRGNQFIKAVKQL